MDQRIPDPNISIDEVGVPQAIAKILTVPELSQPLSFSSP